SQCVRWQWRPGGRPGERWTCRPAPRPRRPTASEHARGFSSSSQNRPDLADALQFALDAIPVAGAQHALEITQRRPKGRHGLRERLAVLFEDLPPDFRARGCDGTGVLEAAAGDLE